MDIPAALTAVSAALGIVKQVRDIDKDYDTALLKSQMAELYMGLADVKMALTDARQEIHDRDQAIRELEEKLSDATSGEKCPLCGTGRLKVVSVRPHPQFAFAGIQEHTLRCENSECKHSEKRKHDPDGRSKK